MTEVTTEVQMSDERSIIINALGGPRGLIDNGLPSILFLIVFNVQHDLRQAIIASIALSAILTLARIVSKGTLQHALTGFIGVLICAWFASRGGQAKDYYIPSFLKNSFYALAYAIGNFIGWPLIGVMFGPLFGENFEWRKSKERRRVYTLASWVWFGMFIVRLAIMFPLYKFNQVNALGVASLVLGYPLFLFVVWWTWLIIRSVPIVQVQPKAE